ncbi:MAG: hypothetical protein KY476_10930 [Planctomycetes bacterium]|nr:hypothetical protein [Planctomycetota bacterium]
MRVRGQAIRVKPDQIVVWISVAAKGIQQLPPQSARLPAILDTGCNHNLLIRRDQLLSWTGMDIGTLPPLRRVRVHGREAISLAANFWLQPNRPGCRDEFAATAPFLFETLHDGIVVTADDQDAFPRLPLLGLRALRRAKLDLHIDGRRCRVTIRRRRWFGMFG